MYLDKISTNDIQKFIKDYVKKLHQEKNEDEINLLTEIQYFKNKVDFIQVSTLTGNSSGSIVEDWILTPYKAYFCRNYRNEESTLFLKEWSKFIYKSLKNKDEKLAEEYKKSFMENIFKEKNEQIKQANNKYSALKL